MKNFYSREDVRIARLAEARPILKNLTFVECTIKGPAVLASLGTTDWISNSFESLDAFLEVPEDRTGSMLFGVIGVEDCRFERCTFERVGLIGPPEFINRFLKDVTD